MARFPRIDSPCPYKSDLAAVMDGDFCRMCERNVFDLSAMSDGDRVAFLAGCTGEVCVSYRMPFRPALAAAVLAAATVALPTAAAAQDQDVSVQTAMAEDVGEAGADASEMIWVGGIKDPANAEYVESAADSAIPDLPVVYEDAPAKPAAPARPGTESRPVRPPAGS